jgi:hypothetical protein
MNCHFCGSSKIFLPSVGIAVGMGGCDYSFCRKCLKTMTAEEFWKVFFTREGYAWPIKLRSGVADEV